MIPLGATPAEVIRAAFLLRVEEGLSFRQIANVLGLTEETARWRVSLYVENIADKGYYTLIIPGVLHGVPGAPRTWGVDAALKW